MVTLLEIRGKHNVKKKKKIRVKIHHALNVTSSN